jgi:D-amino-acid dehydrogenase
MTSVDVVVVGGGVLGAGAAYHLARAGARALVVDRRDEGHATWAGAGIVCPVTASMRDPRLLELAFSSAAHYPTLVAWVAADLANAGPPASGTMPGLGGDETGFAMVGMLSVGVAGGGEGKVAAVDAWARAIASTTSYGRLARSHPVQVDEALRRCPVLTEDLEAAVLVEWAARVDGNRFRDALLAAAVTRGATVRNATVDAVDAGRNGARVYVGDDVIDAGWVVLAGGVWTDRLWPLPGVIRATRGEILHIAVPGHSTGTWPLVNLEGDGPYMVPWPGGRLAVGATVVPTRDLDPRPTLSGARWLFDSLVRATGGRLGEAKLVEFRVGFRPATTDDLPLIGHAMLPTGEAAERVLLATGHNATGLSWGPYTGQLIAGLVTGAECPIDIGPFSPGRFAN